ncbi:ComF family protein [Cellvibrio sp. KY-GH-1]|uniref:ComF family protein n=1 Tax=Cellvibrio sp. KY-GH-1 TaxID=2303332 RepID=UPI001CDA4EF1|nr:ComF family protein [Cellvibrio sp. KY-GH-1]
MTDFPFLYGFINQLIPNHCLLCGDTLGESLICTHCHEQLPHLEAFPFLCSCCALPLKSAAPFCGHCLERKPAFSRSCIAFSYEHPLDFLIHQFKYRRQLTSGKLLGEMLADTCRQAERPDFLVPAPIHWRKRWRRGFNQTELLARQVGKLLQLPVVDALRQTRYHESQKDLGRKQRQKNLRQSLALRNKFKARVEGAHIALVDDVVTTAATARALSELLLKAGAQRVDIWALARTPEN